MELVLTMQGPGGVGAQLYRELGRAILDGRLQPGEKLPSSRELGWRLRISRNTVTEAYERLVAEGYLDARQGSGTFVTAHGLARPSQGGQRLAVRPRFTLWARSLGRSHSIVPTRNLPVDFRPGQPDLDHFPIEAWRRLVARHLQRLTPEMALYGDAQGMRALRVEVARYLSHSRAVHCTADDIIITSGSQQALDIVGRLLISRGTRVAVEDPGYPVARAGFQAIGARIVPVPVDADGMDVAKLPANARLVYSTPSHQFPLGVALSLARRKALLDWAARLGAMVIEDDYDSEFRYGGRPLESLQGMDRSGTVIYLGTFSKVLFPALRLGYVVVPERMRERFIAAKWITDRHTTALEQSVMAAFMAQGHFSKYMRRMQRIYRERQSALLEALKRFVAPWIEPLPSHAGLHVSAWLPTGFDTEELIRRSYEAGVGLYPIAPFFSRGARPGLMFGYGACAVADIEEGVRRLRGLLQSMDVTPAVGAPTSSPRKSRPPAAGVRAGPDSSASPPQ
jgi:GntR family transcriptional regulator / MocR family aminotransferase